jgi:hypothetical protein
MPRPRFKTAGGYRRKKRRKRERMISPSAKRRQKDDSTEAGWEMGFDGVRRWRRFYLAAVWRNCHHNRRYI